MRKEADLRIAERRMNEAARAGYREQIRAYREAGKAFFIMVDFIPDEPLKAAIVAVISAIVNDQMGAVVVREQGDGYVVDSFRLEDQAWEAIELHDGVKPSDVIMWLEDVLRDQSAMWAAFAFSRIEVKGDSDGQVGMILDERMVWMMKAQRFIGFSPTNNLELVWEIKDGKTTSKRLDLSSAESIEVPPAE